MEDNKIINELISRLDAEDIWFTQKTDPTFGEAPDYFKLDEYGDLTEGSIKKIIKEIKSLIGEGAVDIIDAIELWVQDAMVDNKIAYKDILVTKFKDKPVVAGIEAYKNPVQLGESKSLKTENKVFSALNELNASNFVELKDEVEKLYNEEIIDDGQYDKFIDIIDEEENKCEDYLRRRSKVTNTDWKDELGIESDYVVSALQMLIAEVTDLDESKKTESIEEVPENAVIKQGMCPYCGSKKLDINREPEVVEYNEYVSYFWHCKDCGKDGQEIYGMEFLGHDVFQDDETDSYTEFLAKTECKEVKQEGKHFVCVSKLQEETLDIVDKLCNDGVSFHDAVFQLQELGYHLAVPSRNFSRKTGMPTRGMLYKGNENSLVTIIQTRNGKCSWETEGPVYYDESKKVNFNSCTKDKKEENAKRRLKEENNKSANLISQMMQEKGFDAESNAGKIVIRTSALFNALSEKGYDVQVAFDNGESTNAVLLGEQGGQVLVTITDAQQPLKSFASGNFEVTDENLTILNNIADIVKTI